MEKHLSSSSRLDQTQLFRIFLDPSHSLISFIPLHSFTPASSLTSVSPIIGACAGCIVHGNLVKHKTIHMKNLTFIFVTKAQHIFYSSLTLARSHFPLAIEEYFGIKCQNVEVSSSVVFTSSFQLQFCSF